jgi:hypothetical protein
LADTVTSATLLDGPRILVRSFTNQSDGTGESAVKKVDASDFLATATTGFSIRKVYYATQGMAVKVLWDADTDVLAWTIPPDASGEIDFSDIGGLKNNAGTGVTGDINFTTVGHTTGDSYNIVLTLVKEVA